MQQDFSDDYVLATGEMHSVREFVEKSFAHVGTTIQWQGADADEVGLDAQTGKVIVRIDREAHPGWTYGATQSDRLVCHSTIFPASRSRAAARQPCKGAEGPWLEEARLV